MCLHLCRRAGAHACACMRLCACAPCLRACAGVNVCVIACLRERKRDSACALPSAFIGRRFFVFKVERAEVWNDTRNRQKKKHVDLIKVQILVLEPRSCWTTSPSITCLGLKAAFSGSDSKAAVRPLQPSHSRTDQAHWRSSRCPVSKDLSPQAPTSPVFPPSFLPAMESS